MRAKLSLSVLIILLTFIQTSIEKEAINIFAQKNGIDILQLRNKGNKMFNALYKNSPKKWNIRDADGNYVIPYTFAARYDPKEMSAFHEAIRRIEVNTCIRFRERTNEHDFVEIQNLVGEGCYTNVGRTDGKGILMLESNYRYSCMEPESVLHELMHVIGLWHEHMRYDRDQYIKVHFENIEKDYWNQFKKISPFVATTYNVPYDYKSIMHYDKTSFAKNGTISMETLDPRFQDVIGKQKDASPNDYKKICEIYQCNQCMNESYSSNIGNDESAVLEPTPITDPGDSKACQDINPALCKSLAGLRLLDCSYIGRRQCCDTCASLGLRSKTDSLFDFFFGTFRF